MNVESVASVKQLAFWSRQALVGHPALYHVGSLAKDRHANPIINSLADTALLLAETQYLCLQQRRMPLAEDEEDRWHYLAVRSSGGYAPSAIITLRLTSFEWRALRAIRDREDRISATRAISDALTYSTTASFDVARSMLQLLQDRQLIAPAQGKGWQLSPAGLEALT